MQVEKLRAKLAGAIQSIEEVVQLTRKQEKLYLKMRNVYIMAHVVGVHPRDVARIGYREPTRAEHAKWSQTAQRKLSYYEAHAKTLYAVSPMTDRVCNMVELKNGNTVKLPEPVFLDEFADQVKDDSN